MTKGKARVRVPALGLRPRELLKGAVAAAVMGAATSLASRYLARLLSAGRPIAPRAATRETTPVGGGHHG
jgi:hypothetical protein